MQIAELFTKTNAALNDIVMQIRPEQLDLVMPEYSSFEKGQNLRTTLNICAHENACVPPMLAGKQNLTSNPEITEDYLKDDFKTNFANLTETANEAVLSCSEQDLDRIVHMSYADVPARDYLRDIVIQRSMSAIDIAQVAGISFTWPEDLLQAIWDITQANAQFLREYNVFPPEVSIPADASLQDKLIALMGRQP